MKQTAAVLTADGRSDSIEMLTPVRGGDSSLKTIIVQGGFGSGTATVQVSGDGGTTWIDVKDDAGTVVAFTVNGNANVNIMSDALNPALLSVNLAGSTTPTVTLIVFDGH